MHAGTCSPHPSQALRRVILGVDSRALHLPGRRRGTLLPRSARSHQTADTKRTVLTTPPPATATPTALPSAFLPPSPLDFFEPKPVDISEQHAAMGWTDGGVAEGLDSRPYPSGFVTVCVTPVRHPLPFFRRVARSLARE